MYINARRPIQSIVLFFVFVLFGASSASATPPPPDDVELTRAEMNKRKITFTIRRRDAHSSIDLEFPKRLRGREFWLVPYAADVVIKNKAGQVIASSSNQVENNGTLWVKSSYNHLISDLSVSISYVCARPRKNGCYGATIFGISSVSKFIDANRAALNQLPTCREVPGTPIKLFDCT